ncbi:MAG: hypothetical protein WC956_06255 [bacterium]
MTIQDKFQTGSFDTDNRSIQSISAFENALKHSVSMRVAAFVVAIDRVTRASEMRGLYA